MTTPQAVSVAEKDSLDRSALRGVAWSSAAKWTTQLFSWAATILVARILDPTDYGLLSMASAFMGIVSTLSEFGIGTTVLTMREIESDRLHQLNGFSIMLGLAGTLITVLAAYPLGLFFRAPQLPLVLCAVGLTFTINSLQTVPGAILRREMRFRELAMIDLVRGFAMPLTTFLFALLGFRYWALALGGLVGAGISSWLALWYRRQPAAWPRSATIRPILHFSRDLLVGRVAWVVYQNGDFAVAGRMLGTAAAGVYNLAWTLATNPLDKITLILSDVAPSLFSAVQHDRAALRRYFLNLSELLCLATFPASVGLALVSRDLVHVVLGPKWDSASLTLSLLAIYAGARSVTLLFGILFTAARETRFAMWTSLATAILLLTGFIIGSHWGGAGIAAAWMVVHPSMSVISFQRVKKVLDLTGGNYFRTLRLGLDGTMLMVAALVSFQYAVAADWSPALRLTTSIVLGGLVFGGGTWLLHRERLKHIINWLKRARSGAPVTEV
jgi:PST family polysaccharide transporter